MTTSTQTQFRRGTSTQVGAMTPALGEVVVDTSNKRLNLGDASTAGGIPLPNYIDLMSQKFTYATVGGTANAITLTNTKPITSYVAGQKFQFKAPAANTGAMTANVDGQGNKNIKKISSGALADPVANDVIGGGNYEITYDGTQFQIEISDGANSGIGKFVQMKYASLTSTASTSSGTFVDTGLSVSITPTSASNNILVFASLGVGVSVNGVCMLQLLRTSTPIGIGAPASSRTSAGAQVRPGNANAMESVSLLTVDSPATTGATTYKVQFLCPGGSSVAYINRTDIDTDDPGFPRTASTIIVIEIAP